MDQTDGVQNVELDMIQRSIEDAANQIAHSTQSDRQKEVKKTPTEVTVREGAAARSSRPIEKKCSGSKQRKPGPIMQ